MRVARVITNYTCNQNCWFCNGRRPAEDREFVARPAVWRRIADAVEAGPREIVLTGGGEPAMRRDLTDLVRRAGTAGAAVVLETNATLIDAARAAELAAAGLRTARVQLVAWGDDADAITRDPGGFAAALDGMRALQAAGVAIEVTVPVVRRNLLLLPELVRQLAASDVAPAAVILVVPTDAPDPSECASVSEAAAAIDAASESARRVGLTLRLDAGTFIPPCVFARPGRVAHLFALNRGHGSRRGFTRVEACGGCQVNDRCPGLPEGLAANPPPLHPVDDDRLRRRLTVVSSVEEQIAREFLGRDELRSGTDEPIPEYTVRINFHCNQACAFCFVSTHLPPPAEAAVEEAIARAGRERAVLVLSGGEPSLNPRLVEYVATGKRQGVRTVELQSNAIRLGDNDLAAKLAAAGLDRAMVSLHGSTAEISDGITGAPGTFAATVRGIDALARTPVLVRLNFVFCQANLDDFPRFVELVAGRWPTVGIVFSFVGSHTDVVPRTAALIPRFSDVMPPLLAGLAQARAAGLEVSGFDSMCGLPLCLVPEGERAGFSTIAVAPGDGGGEFVKGEVCAGCAERQRCYGIRRGYAELYGTTELRPLTVSEPASPARGADAS